MAAGKSNGSLSTALSTETNPYMEEELIRKWGPGSAQFEDEVLGTERLFGRWSQEAEMREQGSEMGEGRKKKAGC